MTTAKRRKRAIGEAQKEERRQSIVASAWALFQHTPYEALTMSDVAVAAGLAKGTLFLYFDTKEALFLAVVEQQLAGWFSEVNTQLEGHCPGGSIPGAAAIICSALESRPGLVRLLAILHTILEHNIDLDTAVGFKRFLLEHFARTGELLEGRLPFLEPGTGSHLLLQSYALVIGLWHLSDPAPVVQEALQRPELGVFRMEFGREFSAALQALWRGVEHASQTAETTEDQEKHR